MRNIIAYTLILIYSVTIAHCQRHSSQLAYKLQRSLPQNVFSLNLEQSQIIRLKFACTDGDGNAKIKIINIGNNTYLNTTTVDRLFVIRCNATSQYTAKDKGLYYIFVQDFNNTQPIQYYLAIKIVPNKQKQGPRYLQQRNSQIHPNKSQLYYYSFQAEMCVSTYQFRYKKPFYVNTKLIIFQDKNKYPNRTGTVKLLQSSDEFDKYQLDNVQYNQDWSFAVDYSFDNNSVTFRKYFIQIYRYVRNIQQFQRCCQTYNKSFNHSKLICQDKPPIFYPPHMEKQQSKCCPVGLVIALGCISAVLFGFMIFFLYKYCIYRRKVKKQQILTNKATTQQLNPGQQDNNQQRMKIQLIGSEQILSDRKMKQ